MSGAPDRPATRLPHFVSTAPFDPGATDPMSAEQGRFYRRRTGC